MIEDNKSVPKFDNSFWNEEIGNFQGWELVLRRLKDGRQILKEYSEFLKQRAIIEEHLGKSLVKLAKTVLVREELEPLRYVWEVLKAETENSGLTHLKSSHQLLAEANKVNEFSETFREKRRAREDGVRQHQHSLKLQWKRLCDSKRNYELKCREEVASNQFYHQEVSRLGKNSREAEKAHAKYAKARQALDFSESAYQSSVTSVEEARTSWEKETERTFLSFQCIEEDRLINVRDSLWRVSNIVSAAAVDDDKSAEELRKGLESCDLDDAMCKFIAQNTTGEKRPSPVTFKKLPTSSSVGLGRADSTHPTLQDDQRVSPAKSPATSPIHVSQLPFQQQQHYINLSRSQTPYHKYSRPIVSSMPGGSVSLSSLHEFVRANTNNYNRALYTNAKESIDGSRTNSQISLATSPERLQNNSIQSSKPPLDHDRHTSLGVVMTPVNPPARPRKPPRLLQYPNVSNYHPMNRSRSCSPEKPMRMIDTVENTEYFNLPDDSGTPPSSDYQSDLSGSGGECTTGGDSGIYSIRSPSSQQQQNRLSARPPSPLKRSSTNVRNIPITFSRNLSPGRSATVDKCWNLNLAGGHAVVLYDYKKLTPTELTLGRNQIVQIVESKPGSDWWRVRDETGNEGFYPSNFLKVI